MCNRIHYHWLFLILYFQSVSSLFFGHLFSPDPNLAASCRGECMLCTSCWLSGGQITSYCGGFIQICCESPPPAAEARKIDLFSEPLTNELGEYVDIEYGQVLNDPECGKQVISRRRVVGGQDAGFGRFPWQALIRIGKSRCGGALVNKRHVVTAGHCVYNTSPYMIRLFLGEYALYRVTEPLPREEFSVTSIHRHPYYRFSPQADRYDVAVLRLDRDVEYKPHIRPICLPDKDAELQEGMIAHVAGWGAMWPDSKKRPTMLQSVDVKVVENKMCERWHKGNHIKVHLHDDMMCAGHEFGGKDACQGDSGGPLMTQDLVPKNNISQGGQVWTLIGIVSAGYSCAKPGQPGIYHRVTKTSDWISFASRLSSTNGRFAENFDENDDLFLF